MEKRKASLILLTTLLLSTFLYLRMEVTIFSIQSVSCRTLFMETACVDRTVLSFVPCYGESSPNLSIHILVIANTSLRIAVSDWEQFYSTRTDLYGYLANAAIDRFGTLSFVYPPSIPCWSIYLELSCNKPSRIWIAVSIIELRR